MDDLSRHYAGKAIEALDDVLGQGPEVPHQAISEATRCVVAFRNCLIEKARDGRVSRECLDRGNSIMSLAFGAEYPLMGFHRKRLEQTRDSLVALLKSEAVAEADGNRTHHPL